MKATNCLRKRVTRFAWIRFSVMFFAASLAQIQGAESNSVATFRYFGTVQDDNEQPVADVRVECYQSRQVDSVSAESIELAKVLSSDAKGRFEFQTSNSSPVFLLAQKTSFAPVWRNTAETKEKEHRLVIHRAGTFSGVVLDRGKQPVADAEVWCAWVMDQSGAAGGHFWQSILSGSLSRKLFSARSAADGSFRIDGFPSNAVALLAARKAGLASPPTSSSSESWFAGGVSARVGQQNLQVIVEPTGSCEGHVTIGGTDPTVRMQIKDGVRSSVIEPGITGQPVAKAQVILKPQSENWAEQTLVVSTTDDGTFRFPDVAPGHYLLRGIADPARAPGLVITGPEYYLQSGERVTNLILRAVPGGTLVVNIRSKEDGRPIPGATLTFYHETYVSDQNGVHTLLAPAGKCEIAIQKTGFQQNTLYPNAVAGMTNSVECLMVPLPKITGSVLDPSGKPVSGAQLIGFITQPYPDLRTESAADGSFELPWNANWERMMRPPFSSGVVARDITNGLAAFVPFVAGNKHMVVQLGPGLTISGRVENDQGQALGSAKVGVRFHIGTAIIEFDEAKTDVDGHFEYHALLSGYEYRVFARKAGRQSPEVLVAASQTNRIILPPIILNSLTNNR